MGTPSSLALILAAALMLGACAAHEGIRAFYRGLFKGIPSTDLRVVPSALVVSGSGDLAYESGENVLVLDSAEGPREVRSVPR